MKLKALVVADPVGNVAELLTGQCRRLAMQRAVATTGEHALSLVKELRPEVVILSLEIARPSAAILVPHVLAAAPKALIVGTYRQLQTAARQQLEALGVHEFVAHPIAATEIFRAVSNRFALPFRQFQRFGVTFGIQDADGKSVGQALDLSEGGLRFTTQAALPEGENLTLGLQLPNASGDVLQVGCSILAVTQKGGAHLTRGQFHALQDTSRQRLLAYLDTLQTKLDAATY